MSIKSRLKKLETLPMKPDISMDNMTEISPEQAEKIYNELMAGPPPPLFVRTQKGTIPINDLSELELSRTYKDYANGNLDTITQLEV